MPSPDDSCAVWTSSLHLRRCSPGLLCCRSRCGKLQAWNVGHAVLDIGPAVLNICLCSPAMSDQQSWTFRPAVLDVCLCGPAMSDLQSCNVGPAVVNLWDLQFWIFVCCSTAVWKKDMCRSGATWCRTLSQWSDLQQKSPGLQVLYSSTADVRRRRVQRIYETSLLMEFDARWYAVPVRSNASAC